MLNLPLLALALTLQSPAGPSPVELAWGDLNSDGLLDLLIVDEEHNARYYQNTGDGDFEERTVEVGLAGVGDLRFGAWQDLDADGHTDLLLGTAEGVRLFQNVNGKSLIERTRESGLDGLNEEVLICGWIDFDEDGYVDMQLMTRTNGYLLRNEGPARGQQAARFVQLKLAGVGLLPAAPGGPGGPGAFPPLPGGPAPGARTQITQRPNGSGGFLPSIVSGGCASRLLDFANQSACLPASSVPTMGMLYPISQELFVDAGTGFVGIGVTDPQGRLDVAGMVRIRSVGVQFPDGTIQSTAQVTGPTGPIGDVGPIGPEGPAGPQGPLGPQGPTGPQGLPGETGSQGLSGEQGPQGPQGPSGPQGPQGAMGQQGPQGIVGPTGPQGSQGNVGETGAEGSTGEQGPQGDTGAQGPAGPTGPIGDTGPEGTQGLQGDTGAQGPAGPTGPIGDTGPEGAQGLQGDTGAQGPAGSTGPIGDTGPEGAQGLQGDTGAQGPAGPTGPIGDTGPEGTQGLQGDTGPQGPTGSEGIAGSNGAQGPQGPQGQQGQQGQQGVAGPSGPMGPMGPAGSQGPQGSQGDPGLQGPQGTAGPTGPIGPEGPAGDSSWNASGSETRTDHEVGVLLINEPVLGALDIGEDFVMRDSSDIGINNSRIRFHVLPMQSELAFLDGDEEEDAPDIIIIREDDSGGNGDGSEGGDEPANVTVGTINTSGTKYTGDYEDPEVEQVVIGVKPGGGGVSVDPYLAFTGGAIRIDNGTLQLPVNGGLAMLRPGASALSLELVGEDPSGNTDLAGFIVGPIAATSLDTGPVNATSIGVGQLTANSIIATELNTENFSVDNFNATNLDLNYGTLDELTVNNGGAIFLEHGTGLEGSMLGANTFTGEAFLSTPGFTLKDTDSGSETTFQVIKDSFDGTGDSLSLNQNLQVGGELGITERTSGDQVFFQALPRFSGLLQADDDDGDVVVKRRSSSGATSTASTRSSGTYYEDPETEQVIIGVKPGGGGVSEDPFLQISGGNLRMAENMGLQFGDDGRFDLSPSSNNELVLTGGGLALNGGDLNVGTGNLSAGSVHTDGIFASSADFNSLQANSLQANSLSADLFDVPQGGSLQLTGETGVASMGIDDRGVIAMTSPSGISLADEFGSLVDLKVVPSSGLVSASGTLKILGPLDATQLTITDSTDLGAATLRHGPLGPELAMEAGDSFSVGGAGLFESPETGFLGIVDSHYSGANITDRPAVRGSNDLHPFYGIGGQFSGGYYGVEAKSEVVGTGSRYGVRAKASGGNNNYGVRTEAVGAGHGIYAKGNSGAKAGTFLGNVDISGSLSKGGGSFKIDHPLDPENKYLFHSFVESPDMMNIYNGNTVFDASGEVEVELPDWFDGLNREFRYQLTCVGGFAPVYVSQEIEGNRFMIAGGNEGLKVSWQVTGIRKDAWAEANRIPTEVDKAPADRGRYLHPEARGLSAERGLYDAREQRERESRVKVGTARPR